LQGKKNTLTFAVPKRNGITKTRQRKAALSIEKRAEKKREKKVKKLLAEMKKESHLCNPKQGEHKPESARLEGIENEQRGKQSEK